MSADLIDFKPQFSFMAESADPDNKAGLARWAYAVERRGEAVDVIVRQRFDSFEAANAMNDLICVAFNAGVTRGERSVRDAVLATVRAYC